MARTAVLRVPPALVGVDGDARLWAGRLAHGRDALLVALGRVADLDLEDGDALGDHGPGLDGERLGLVPAEGDDLLDAVPRAAADEIVERPPESLALQIPQGHLHGGAGGLVAHREELALPDAVDRLDVEGVPADHRRPEVLADHVLDAPQRLAGELVRRAGLADAGDALVGLHADEVAGAVGHRRRGDHERLLHGQLEGVDVDGGDLHRRGSASRVLRSSPVYAMGAAGESLSGAVSEPYHRAACEARDGERGTTRGERP